ncbi:ribosomal RNA small subunit methyltransferase A [Candidatus Kuenenbacteria bacterium HGW-Kuenenbacteria-1]|uniref:Ribosomal RNA small subunit methyltransferase A n=1 Tax=Candidatus Kuenenbacteria bacterium HGW-Kuenenbacteria-1 TaxID=2013812 RepID=A0A2N1UP46_9BACT|nr:MAG: ribosomal RNA small subunit methyltransferase A [Candidatus Kuenenbacteria bacterium HGW-Kuenenbacteria-1]
MENVKLLCEKYGLHPQRQAGQNFLIDKNILNKIIQVAELKKDDVILEIGAGFGVLTRELAGRVKKVIAVELDKRLVVALKEELKNFKNIVLINKDILKIQNLELKIINNKYKIVANVPYNITSAILRKFLSEELIRPSEMILLIQKEVAERIIAKPGQMSLLSISVQFYSQPKIISVVSKNSFWPAPKVNSAIIKLNLNKQFNIEIEKDFFDLVRAGFSSRRKQLKNNLKKIKIRSKKTMEKIFEELNFNPMIRAQELSVKDWVELYKKIHYTLKAKS